jgi:hypothetical protein
MLIDDGLTPFFFAHSFWLPARFTSERSIAGMALIALGLAAVDGRLVHRVARILRVAWSDLAR